ncbi:hypothetical protein Efla_000969 [Eimeria flavescens]
MYAIVRLALFLPVASWGGAVCSSSSSESSSEIASYVILTVRGLPESAEAAAVFEDDIEDPLLPQLPSFVDPLLSEPFPSSPAAAGAAAGAATAPAPPAAADRPRGEAAAAEEVPLNAAGSSASSAGDTTNRPRASSTGAATAAARGEESRQSSQKGTERPSSKVKERPSSRGRLEGSSTSAAATAAAARKPLLVLGFAEALAAFDAALKGPQVPWHVRLALGRVRGLKQPSDALLASFQAALLQTAGYMLQCVGEFRKLKHLDQGRARCNLQEIQSLRSKNAACTLPIKVFLEESKNRLGPPLRQRGPAGGWDKAASFLDALFAYAVAMEKNYAALTNYLEATLGKSHNSSGFAAIKGKREAAQLGYKTAKAAAMLLHAAAASRQQAHQSPWEATQLCIIRRLLSASFRAEPLEEKTSAASLPSVPLGQHEQEDWGLEALEGGAPKEGALGRGNPEDMHARRICVKDSLSQILVSSWLASWILQESLSCNQQRFLLSSSFIFVFCRASSVSHI